MCITYGLFILFTYLKSQNPYFFGRFFPTNTTVQGISMLVNITIEQIVGTTSKDELIKLRDTINTRLISLDIKSTQLDEHEKGLVAGGDMVAAIINYRDRNGGSLAECRDAIGGFIAQLSRPQRSRPPMSYDQVWDIPVENRVAAVQGFTEIEMGHVTMSSDDEPVVALAAYLDIEPTPDVKDYLAPLFKFEP